MSIPQSQGAGGENIYQQVAFTLALDKAVYPFNAAAPSHAQANLVFIGTVAPPVVLEFFSLQHFDVIIINDNGDQVFQWSAGRAFPQIASNIPVTGEIEWDVDITLTDNLTANEASSGESVGDLTGFNYWVGRRENSSRSLGQYPEVSGWTGTVCWLRPRVVPAPPFTARMNGPNFNSGGTLRLE